MNRRSFFSWLAVSPVAALVPAPSHSAPVDVSIAARGANGAHVDGLRQQLEQRSFEAVLAAGIRDLQRRGLI